MLLCMDARMSWPYIHIVLSVVTICDFALYVIILNNCRVIENAKLDIFDVLHNNESGGDSNISLRLP